MEEVKSPIDKNFEEYIGLLTNNIHRDGINNLINWLMAKDTKIAPASTKYHCAVPGGLVMHSLNVYRRLKQLLAMEYPSYTVTNEDGTTTVKSDCPYSEETITLVSLLHDIAKVNFYDIQERNAKNEKGEWIKVPFYAVKDESDRLIFGSHPVNSYYMVSKFIGLKYEEELAILHHEGAFETVNGIQMSNIMAAFKKSPLAIFLHHADIMATCIDEVADE